MPSTKPKRYDILGVTVDAITMDEATQRIIERSTQPGAVYVTKPYVEFLDRAQGDEQVTRLLNDSFLVLPDAVSLQWASSYLYGGKAGLWRALRLAGQIVLQPRALTSYIPERFAGTVFTWELLEECARAGRSVYLIGGPDAAFIERTATVIGGRLPDLKLVGCHPGVIGGRSHERLRQELKANKGIESELVAALKEAEPDIILVGMGFPLQEELMAKLTPQLDHGVLIGEGGTFDYDSFGGGHRKAPAWMQRIGLEWLWRLLLEPSRWRRQLAIPRFMRAVYRQKASQALANHVT